MIIIVMIYSSLLRNFAASCDVLVHNFNVLNVIVFF